MSDDCGLGWDGKNIRGDKASIEAVREALHTQGIVPALRARLNELLAERECWNRDARRLSGGLLAIRNAAENVPASVLRGIAYDIALNCIDPDTAAYQIERRAALAAQDKGGEDASTK